MMSANTACPEALRPLLQARFDRTLAHLRETMPPELDLLQNATLNMGRRMKGTLLARETSTADALDTLEAAGPEIVAATLAELHRWGALLPEPVRAAVLLRAVEAGPDGRPPFPWLPYGPAAALLVILLDRHCPPRETSLLWPRGPALWPDLAFRWLEEHCPPDFQRDPGAVSIGLALCLAEREERPELRAWETMTAVGATKPGEVRPVHLELAALACPDEGEQTRQGLAAELATELRRARRTLGMDGPPPAGAEARRELPDTPGLLWLDEIAARFVEPLGKRGEPVAAAWRRGGAERWAAAFGQHLPEVERPPVEALWRLWLPRAGSRPVPGTTWDAGAAVWDEGKTTWDHLRPSRFALSLARCLWERMEAERAKPAALIMPVHEAAMSLHCRGLAISTEQGAIVEATGQRVLSLRLPDEADAPELPVIDLAALGPLLAAGIQRMGSLTAQRLLRWEVVTGHRQALSGGPDARRIEVEGGWGELARRIGERSRKAIAALPGIVAVQGCAVWTWPDGTRGNLLQWEERPAAPGRPALVKLTLGDMLLPGAVLQLAGRSREVREARRLVPMVDQLPPMAGRAREQGPQAALQLAVMAELRRHALELAQRGSVRIPLKRWADMATHVGLPRGMVGKVLEAWTRDGKDAPAFLTRPDARDRWRFGLAGAYEPALAFLLTAGRRAAGGAEAGRSGRQKRATALEAGRAPRRRRSK